MERFNNIFLDTLYLIYRYATLFVIVKPLNFVRFFTFYLRDMIKYKSMKGAEKVRIMDTYPILEERTQKTAFDPQYFYQSVWATKLIYQNKPNEHVDVGSQISFIGGISTFTKATFIDIRPLKTKLDNLKSKKGTIIKMPYGNNSIKSLSCLHVAEHVGLGRYGDQLDPLGTKKATKELKRVLAKDGNLYFSLPIGKPRLCFNAHRIHSPDQILEYFKGLKLLELSGVDDKGNFKRNAKASEMKNWNYGCGLFHFTKK